MKGNNVGYGAGSDTLLPFSSVSDNSLARSVFCGPLVQQKVGKTLYHERFSLANKFSC